MVNTAHADDDINPNRFEKENSMSENAETLGFKMPHLAATVLQSWSIRNENAILRNTWNGNI